MGANTQLAEARKSPLPLVGNDEDDTSTPFIHRLDAHMGADGHGALTHEPNPARQLASP